MIIYMLKINNIQRMALIFQVTPVRQSLEQDEVLSDSTEGGPTEDDHYDHVQV